MWKSVFAAFLIALAMPFQALAQSSANGLVYHGRILKPDSEPFQDSSVSFSVRIYGRNLAQNKRCLIYQETHSGKNMTGSLGVFELMLGEGSRSFPSTAPEGGLSRIFLNSVSNSLSAQCSDGSTAFVADSVYRDREIEVSVQGSSGSAIEIPAQALRATPWALQALEVGGYGADYLAKLHRPSSSSALSSVALPRLSASQVTDYQTYLGTLTAPQRQALSGIQIFNIDLGSIQYFDGTNWQSVGAAGSGISSINGHTDVSQNLAIGSTGTDVNLSYSGGTHTFNFPDASATARGVLSSVDWTTFNNKQSTALDDGKIWIGGATNVAVPQAITGDVAISNLGVVAVNKIKGKDVDETGIAANKVLKYDGTKWVMGDDNNTGATYSAGTDISITGGGNAINVLSSTVKANNALVKSGASGQVEVGAATIDSLYLRKSVTESVQIRPPSVAFTSYVLDLPLNAGTLGDVLTTDGNGLLSWNAPASTANNILQGGNTFSPAAEMTIGTNTNHAVNFETNDITRMTILNDGKVGIGTAAPSVKLEVAGMSLFKDPAQTTGSKTLDVQNSSGTSIFSVKPGNATGVEINTTASVGSIALGSGWQGISSSGGNSAGALIFSTNTSANERMRIDGSGNVGIGIAAPLTALHLMGDQTIGSNAVPGGGIYFPSADGSYKPYIRSYFASGSKSIDIGSTPSEFGHYRFDVGNGNFEISKGKQSIVSTFSGSAAATPLNISPTYNQSGTGSSADLLINRTETALGSGAHFLIDAQVGGVSRFSVTNAGVITGNGSGLSGVNGTDSTKVAKAGDAMTGALSIAGSTDTKQLIVKGNATQTSVLQEWQDSTGTAVASISGDGLKLVLPLGFGIGSGTTVQNVAAGGIAIGQGALVGGTGSTDGPIAIGWGASAASGDYPGSISIGRSATSTHKAVAIGKSANSGAGAVTVGYGTSAAGQSLAFGYTSSASFGNSIALGYATATTAANQLAIGGSFNSGYINDVYIGAGVTATAPQPVTLNAGGGSGADVAGADIKIAGGRGTGTGAGGKIVFKTAAAAGSSSSTLNSLSDRMTIDSAGFVGIGTSNPSTKLEVYGAGSQVLKIGDNAGAWLQIQGDSGGRNITGNSTVTIFGNTGLGVTNGGNVGIGTSSPVSKLHVRSAPTASANYGLVSLGSGAFDGSTAGFYAGNANGTVLSANAATGYLGDLINFQVGGTSKFKVDKDGVITGDGSGLSGVTGTDSTKVAKAGDTMNGALAIQGSSDTTQLVLKAHSTQTSNLLQLQNNSGAQLMRVSGAGNVRFGLEGSNDGNTYTIGSTVGSLQFNASGTVSLVSNLGHYFSAESGQGGPSGGASFAFGPGTSAIHSGYSADFHVTSGGTYGNGQSAGNLYLRGGENWAGGTNSNGGDVFVFGGAGSGTGTTGDLILAHTGTVSQGNVGIGTATPTDKLDVEGGRAYLPSPASAPVDADLANSQFSIWLDETNDEIEFKAKKSGGTVITRTLAAATQPYIIGGTFISTLLPSQILTEHPFPLTVTIPAGCTNSRFEFKEAATASTVLSLQKCTGAGFTSCTQFGTATVGAGAKVATFSCASSTTFTGGTDSFILLGPASADLTAGTPGWAIYGTR